MDFGFLQVSAADYTQPLANTDRVVTSFDGYEAYHPVALLSDDDRCNAGVFHPKYTSQWSRIREGEREGAQLRL